MLVSHDEEERPITAGFKSVKDPKTGQMVTNSPQVIGKVVEEDVTAPLTLKERRV